MIPNDDRSRRREILQVEIGDILVPDFLAGLGVQANQDIVGRLHIETVVPHAEPAVADVSSPARLPNVVPDFVAVARIHGPGVVGRRDVNDAADLQRGTFNICERVGFQRPDAVDDEVRTGPAPLRPGHQLAAPRQGQILDRGLIELRQAAVAPAGIVAAIRGPIAGGAEFLEQLGGFELLRREQRGQQQEGKFRCEVHESFHLMVTRYAVTSWMFLSV